MDVAKKLASLYVTYRGRYVIAKDGRYFVPHDFQTGELKRLENQALVSHLNHQYAVGVFSAQYSSKFVCFDVDLPDPCVVHDVIDALCEFGFPKEQIYVSSSGGKGYHVEMFFTDLVFTNLLHDLYSWIIDKKNLDPKKVEFRPTYTQAIKLPLGKHHKTGNICWYLDRDTLAPIEDQGYIATIVPMDRDEVESLIKSHEFKRAVVPYEHSEKYARTKYADDPVMTGPGTRHEMMKQMAVRERYKDTPQEEIEEKLKDWACKQNPAFITDPWGVVMYDAEHLAHDVWKPTFVVLDRNLELSQEDIQKVLSCHAPLQKRILFLIMLHTKRHRAACMSTTRIARVVGCSQQGVQKALSALEERGLITKKQEPTIYSNGKFVGGCNSYSCKLCPSELCSKIEIDWNFKEDTFKGAYLKTIRDNVPQKDWKKYFTKKEIEELTKGDVING